MKDFKKLNRNLLPVLATLLFIVFAYYLIISKANTNSQKNTERIIETVNEPPKN